MVGEKTLTIHAIRQEETQIRHRLELSGWIAAVTQNITTVAELVDQPLYFDGILHSIHVHRGSVENGNLLGFGGRLRIATSGTRVALG
jgi:hypothetical protein